MKRLVLAVLLVTLFGAGCGASSGSTNRAAVIPSKTAPPTPPDHVPLPTPVHPTSSAK